ncbi:MAG: serine hydrolase [Segetibacter sp.]|nr:serine hydrolase [Segetibacter sp.]
MIRMACKKNPSVISLLFLLFTVTLSAQPIITLPRSVPEAEGVSSAGILSFLEATGKSKHEFHSFMFLRHGKVIAEGWWNPYNRDLKHTMYSVSKSFTSTAIGFAVSEKLLTVNDKVISFFPNYLPGSISGNLQELTVKHLLTMSVGQNPDPTTIIPGRDSNWIKAFLAMPIPNKPGSVFLYNSLATYMLSAIVQKVTGQKVIDYLTPRLFKPLGIQGMDWEVDPMGINTGGWGLRVKTEDMAKLGQLYLQKGSWNGKKLLPKEWTEEATTLKILQSPEASQSKRDSSDWLQGYCYQFWRSRHNSFRGDGAFGQYILVLPEQDAVIAITSETADMQGELNLVWDHLLPALKKDKLVPDKDVVLKLNRKLLSLALPLSVETATPSFVAGISGKTFQIDKNEDRIKSLSLQFAGDLCYLNVTSDTGSYKFGFSSSTWKTGETTKVGPYLLASAKARLSGLPPFKVAGHYTWTDKNTLQLTLRYIESPHRQKIICHFTENKILVDFENSINQGNRKGALKGELNN